MQLTDWRASDRFLASRRKAYRKHNLNWRHYTPPLFIILVFGSFLLPGIVAPFGYLQTSEFKAAWKATGVLSLWPLGIAIIPLAALAVLWFCAPFFQKLAFRESPLYGKEFTFSIQDDGIGGDTFIPWIHIQAVEESPTHIFIVLTDNSFYLIPKRAFDSDSAASHFVTLCRNGNSTV